jgi:putative pyruvate formate lyase activating enzyme
VPNIDSKKKLALVEAAIESVRELCRACRLCGRVCGVNRLENEPGFCATDSRDAEHVRYASTTLHFGEEPPLVGRGGSGTVFFTHCNLRCVFCQNYQISQFGLGDDTGYAVLAQAMLALERAGAENINLVTPTHYIYPILLALREAYRRGLARPLVYNTNAFDRVELLALLDGIVDIYLPDMKYSDQSCAQTYSQAAQYPGIARAAILEMYRQTGRLQHRDGVATKGLIIRHLVLPEDQAGSYDFLLWLKDEGLMDVTLSLMRQYSPRHQAMRYERIARVVTGKEYLDVVRYARQLGFEELLVQGVESPDVYLPDFTQDDPFS